MTDRNFAPELVAWHAESLARVRRLADWLREAGLDVWADEADAIEAYWLSPADFSTEALADEVRRRADALLRAIGPG
jgi:hypothetical protein